MDKLVKEVTDLQKEFNQKRGSFSDEELREIMNDLTSLNLAADRMTAEKENIYKLTDHIRTILGSHDEKQNS